MSALGWNEGARLWNNSKPTYFQPAYKTGRRPCTQPLWWPQPPEELGQVKLETGRVPLGGSLGQEADARGRRGF